MPLPARIGKGQQPARSVYFRCAVNERRAELARDGPIFHVELMFCEVGGPTESASHGPLSALGGTRLCAGGCGVAVPVVLVGGSSVPVSGSGTVDGLAVAHLPMHPSRTAPWVRQLLLVAASLTVEPGSD